MVGLLHYRPWVMYKTESSNQKLRKEATTRKTPAPQNGDIEIENPGWCTSIYQKYLKGNRWRNIAKTRVALIYNIHRCKVRVEGSLYSQIRSHESKHCFSGGTRYVKLLFRCRNEEYHATFGSSRCVQESNCFASSSPIGKLPFMAGLSILLALAL